MKTIHRAAGILSLIALGAVAAQAATPQTVKVQGYLSDRSEGTPVPANGPYTMMFDLYETADGGPLIASSGALLVQVVNGIYEVELSFGASDFEQPQRYLEITINGQLLTPRLRVVSTPYAFRTEQADLASGVTPGAVTTEGLAAQSVTADKLGAACDAGQVLIRAASEWICGTVVATPSCNTGDFIYCYSGPPVTMDVGICRAGRRFCLGGDAGYGACAGEVPPASEVCDGLDNDCDGQVDVGAVDAPSWYADADGDGFGEPWRQPRRLRGAGGLRGR